MNHEKLTMQIGEFILSCFLLSLVNYNLSLR